MFGREVQEVRPKGRYYAELIIGTTDLEGLDRENEVSQYLVRQVEYQKDVQNALDRGEQSGWRLVNVTSPSSFQAIQEGNAFGALAPTLLSWDTEPQVTSSQP